MSATTAKLTASDLNLDVTITIDRTSFRLGDAFSEGAKPGFADAYGVYADDKIIGRANKFDNARAEKLADAVLTHATGHARVQTAAGIPEDRAVEGHDPRVRSRLVRLVERAIACQFGN